MNYELRIKKSLGQNFLKNESTARDLAEAARIKPNEVVIEVGPGRGMITKILLEKAHRVIAVEKDDGLIVFLKEKFAPEIKNKKLEVVCNDILTFNPKTYDLTPKTYKLIGSIPYYITGQFLRRFLPLDPQPSTIALIIQKEVGQRIIAKDRKESLLSLSVKAYGEPRYIKTVKAGSFYPKPKVDSAIIAIENISKNFFQNPKVDEQKFFELLRIGFGSKRKKLATNLKKAFSGKNFEEIFENCGISHNIRAENLILARWKALYLALHETQRNI